MEQITPPHNNGDSSFPIPHPFVGYASRHWKRNYVLGAGAIFFTAFLAYIGCNIVNIVHEPTTYLDGFQPGCQPSYIFYPDYERALGFPPRIFEPLFPPKPRVHRAHARTKACFHPDKQHFNPGMTGHIDSMYAVREALEDAHSKLTAWRGYPHFVNGGVTSRPRRWNDPIEDISFPHFKTEGCEPCTFAEAAKNTGYKLITPYWYHSFPSSMEEVPLHCPPCTISTIKEAWSQIITFRFFPFPHLAWNAANLPPRGLHSFYSDHTIFDSTWNPVLWGLAIWGRNWHWSAQSLRGARFSLPKEEKLRFIEEGWMGVNDFMPGDQDVGSEVEKLEKADAKRKAAEEEAIEEQREYDRRSWANAANGPAADDKKGGWWPGDWWRWV